MKEFIRTIPKFGGAVNEDVVKWLQHIDAVFDQVELRSSNKYIAVQFYLTDTAAKWFRYNNCNILDWPTFQCEIIKTFQPSFNSTLLNMTKQQPSSFFSSHLHNQQQSIVDEKLNQIEQEPDVLRVPVLTSSKISLTSTTSQMENEDNQVDLINDNETKSFEDLEDKCPREHEHEHTHEQSSYSPILVSICDPDLNI
jgi:hypothetical protein